MSSDYTKAEEDSENNGSPSLSPETELQLPDVRGAGDAEQAGSVPSPASVGEKARNVASQLFSRVDPTNPSSYLQVAIRELPHFYPPSVVRPLDKRLAAVVGNRSGLFLQGAALGVGASTLATDYARAYNHRAAERGDPGRLLYLSMNQGITSTTKFLDLISNAVRAPVSPTSLQYRSPDTLLRRVVAALSRLRIRALFIDHVGVLPGELRGAIAGLFRVTDPNYRVSLEPQTEAQMYDGPGIVLIDHRRPEHLFRRSPEIGVMLEQGQVRLEPYTSPRQVISALRRAEIGLKSLDPEGQEARDIAKMVLESTSGLVARMNPLFRVVKLITRANDLPRPTPEVFEAAVPFHREIVELTLERRDRHGRRQYATMTKSVQPQSEGSGDSVGSQSTGSSGSKSVLQEKREKRDVAESELEKLLATDIPNVS